MVTAVSDPGPEVRSVRETLEEYLADHSMQSVTTVAETIFPSSLYEDPGYAWTPSLPAPAVSELDLAAAGLYASYIDMLPLIRTFPINKSGTYFSRMVTWPGKEAGGTNQLALRVERLRSLALSNARTNNTLDVDIAADATDPEVPLRGVQVYAATDKRTRSFPCLTHLDFTLHQGRLHCTAVYRHQYLVEKA